MIIEAVDARGTVAGHLEMNEQGHVTFIDGSDLLRELAEESRDGFSIDRSIVKGNYAYNIAGIVILPTDEDLQRELDAQLGDVDLMVGSITE